jgi:hypothetical protein
MNATPQKNTLKSYFELGEVFRYFSRIFTKEKTGNFNLRIMHGINKIAIVMFFLALIFRLIKSLIA